MSRAFLGLGSNLGDRLASLRSACGQIDSFEGTHIVRASSIYETEPFGIKEQPDFLNAVIEIDTSMAAADLHRGLKGIERDAGRIQRQKWGPREIDIDILYFGLQKIHTEALTIPHPGNEQRRFILEPLAELSPEFVDPESGLTVSIMLERCSDHCSVRKYSSEELIMGEES
ncbi:MAG TPA: 2-amino-4-hydroxy-6-hydroxymethyldihydropteridine diphosphokinase [Bacteroidota bacterium]|nr:2-amino-4-hydroxy-6-hydroxymethyldihydropteridine diphosphokinase [Bacteroidota bacterium]